MKTSIRFVALLILFQSTAKANLSPKPPTLNEGTRVSLIREFSRSGCAPRRKEQFEVIESTAHPASVYLTPPFREAHAYFSNGKQYCHWRDVYREELNGPGNSGQTVCAVQIPGSTENRGYLSHRKHSWRIMKPIRKPRALVESTFDLHDIEMQIKQVQMPEFIKRKSSSFLIQNRESPSDFHLKSNDSEYGRYRNLEGERSRDGIDLDDQKADWMLVRCYHQNIDLESGLVTVREESDPREIQAALRGTLQFRN